MLPPSPLLLVAACLSLQMWVACVNDSMVLELHDVQNFRLNQEQAADGLSLEISGLAFHSSLAVERITTTLHDDVLEIRVRLTPARKGLSGSFNFKFAVGNDVNRVVFGNERKAIWTRTSGDSGTN
jgi:hypothetical protein